MKGLEPSTFCMATQFVARRLALEEPSLKWLKHSWRAKTTTLGPLAGALRRVGPLVVRLSEAGCTVAREMLPNDPLATAFLLVETLKTGEPVW
jgi:hypothetical protein